MRKKNTRFPGIWRPYLHAPWGERFGGKSVAVGNRSMFMHSVTGADIAIECFARNLSNQGCMGVIHR